MLLKNRFAIITHTLKFSHERAVIEGGSYHRLGITDADEVNVNWPDSSFFDPYFILGGGTELYYFPSLNICEHVCMPNSFV